MSYSITAYHDESKALELSSGHVCNVHVDVKASLLQINDKIIPLSMVPYQALYGLSCPPGIELSFQELDAARECIHAACRYPLEHPESGELIKGSQADPELPIDFILLSKAKLETSDKLKGIGVHDYPGVDSLKVVIIPSVPILTPLDKNQGITIIRSIGEAISALRQEAESRFPPGDYFWHSCAELVIKNYPGFCADWGYDSIEEPNRKFRNFVKAVITSGASTCFAFKKGKLVGIMLDHGQSEGIHFPHFAIIDCSVQKQGIAKYMLHELTGSGISIFASSNPLVIDKAKHTLESGIFGDRSDLYFYHYPINAPTEALAFASDEEGSPVAMNPNPALVLGQVAFAVPAGEHRAENLKEHVKTLMAHK